MPQNKTKVTKIIAIAKEPSKCLIFENRKVLGNDNKEIIPRTRREVLATLREENKKDVNNPKYYDPEIFLFDDPQKFSNIIENVKEKFNEKFENNPAEDYCQQVMNKLKREKEFGDALDKYYQTTGKDLKDVLKVDNLSLILYKVLWQCNRSFYLQDKGQYQLNDFLT